MKKGYCLLGKRIALSLCFIVLFTMCIVESEFYRITKSPNATKSYCREMCESSGNWYNGYLVSSTDPIIF